MNNCKIVFPSKQIAQLQDCELSAPCKGEVLIKNRKSMISIGTEMAAFSGNYSPGSTWEKNFAYPFDVGYASVGEVVDIGVDVDQSLIGKRVASLATHRRYDIVPLEHIRNIHRQEVTDEEAVFFIIAQIVMRGIRLSKVGWGDCPVIFGMGLLGHFAACFCRLLGARPVFAVDYADFRLDLLPVDHSLIKINPLKQKLLDTVREHTKGRMADIVFEVTGNAKHIPEEFGVLHDQGRFVVMSSPMEKTNFDFHDLCNRPSHTIIGAHNYSHPPFATFENPWTMQRHCELFFDLVADGEIDVKRMVSHRIGYEEAPGMYAKLLEDRSNYMGIIIDWEDSV